MSFLTTRAIIGLICLACTTSSVAKELPPEDKQKSFIFLGFPTKILLSGDDTGGTSAVLEIQVPSKAGPPAHIHSREDEVFLIKSGTFEFYMDGSCLRASEGATVYMPKGHMHTFRNTSEQTGVQLLFAYPAGIERFFREVHDLNLKMPQDFVKLNDLSNRKYGINHVPDHNFRAGTCKQVDVVDGATSKHLARHKSKTESQK